jgi:hypothetical protein
MLTLAWCVSTTTPQELDKLMGRKGEKLAIATLNQAITKVRRPHP